MIFLLLPNYSWPFYWEDDFEHLGGGFKYVYVYPDLEKWSILTNIFQLGWFNHQLVFQLGWFNHQLDFRGVQTFKKVSLSAFSFGFWGDFCWHFRCEKVSFVIFQAWGGLCVPGFPSRPWKTSGYHTPKFDMVGFRWKLPQKNMVSPFRWHSFVLKYWGEKGGRNFGSVYLGLPRLVLHFQDFTTCSPAFFTLQTWSGAKNMRHVWEEGFRSNLREKVVSKTARSEKPRK